MAKARSVILGVGCLVLVIGVVLVALLVRGLAKPKLPSDVVLAINFSGPIAEVTAEDPFAEIMGEQPMSLSAIRRALNRAAEDDRVKGVRVRIESFGGGFAVVQEIRELLQRVRAAGKWTSAYLETAGEFAWLGGGSRLEVFLREAPIDEVVDGVGVFRDGRFFKGAIGPEFFGFVTAVLPLVRKCE